MKPGVMLKILGKVETLEAGACFPLVMETAGDAPFRKKRRRRKKEPSHGRRTSFTYPSLPAG